MPPSDSQTLCRQLVLRSGDIPVAGGRMTIPRKGAQAFLLFLPKHTAKLAVPHCGQDQWAWGAHLRRAQRARSLSLRRKQTNQYNPTTWRLAAMSMAIRGINFDFGKAPASPTIAPT